jgi:leucine zipper transcription factor-like protein 1
MSDDLERLSENHKQQVLNYQKFFNGKMREQLNEVMAEFDDTKEMRVLEDMYNRDDVENIIDGMRDTVKGNVKNEFEKYTNQTCLFLHQLFLQAEGHGANLKIDTSQLDDARMLSAIERLGIESHDTNRRLDAIGGAVDVKLVTQNKELEEQNDRIQDRFNKLQEQMKSALRENTQFKEKVERLTRQLDDTRTDLDNLREGNDDAAQREIDGLRSRLENTEDDSSATVDRLRKDLLQCQTELSGKVSDSTQFRQLRTMVQSKNRQIRELRDQIEDMGDSV